MNVPAPHFLLFSEASDTPSDERRASGSWRFVLEAVDGSHSLEAGDDEHETSPERLELLAIVRGLEALDQPSRVTLVTRSRHVSRGLRFGLEQWRENDWQWERFGQMIPVKNGDLWQRIDHALKIHRVDCRAWKLESADDLAAPPARRQSAHEDSVWLKSTSGRMLRVDSGEPTSDRSAGRRSAPRSGDPRSWLKGLKGLKQWFSAVLRPSDTERAA
jgi:ribonuclease HI